MNRSNIFSKEIHDTPNTSAALNDQNVINENQMDFIDKNFISEINDQSQLLMSLNSKNSNINFNATSTILSSKSNTNDYLQIENLRITDKLFYPEKSPAPISATKPKTFFKKIHPNSKYYKEFYFDNESLEIAKKKLAIAKKCNIKKYITNIDENNCHMRHYDTQNQFTNEKDEVYCNSEECIKSIKNISKYEEHDVNFLMSQKYKDNIHTMKNCIQTSDSVENIRKNMNCELPFTIYNSENDVRQITPHTDVNTTSLRPNFKNCPKELSKSQFEGDFNKIQSDINNKNTLEILDNQQINSYQSIKEQAITFRPTHKIRTKIGKGYVLNRKISSISFNENRINIQAQINNGLNQTLNELDALRLNSLRNKRIQENTDTLQNSQKNINIPLISDEKANIFVIPNEEVNDLNNKNNNILLKPSPTIENTGMSPRIPLIKMDKQNMNTSETTTKNELENNVPLIRSVTASSNFQKYQNNASVSWNRKVIYNKPTIQKHASSDMCFSLFSNQVRLTNQKPDSITIDIEDDVSFNLNKLNNKCVSF